MLVAELLRSRSRALLYEPNLRVVVTEEQWSETQHELDRRLRLFIERGRVTADQIALIRQEIQAVIDENAIEVVPRNVFQHVEAAARRRIPRDPNDWPTVALALTLDAGILTNDNHFLGCGCPTWTVHAQSGTGTEAAVVRRLWG